MQVTLVLKKWGVVQDPKTKGPKLVGTYGIMNGEKQIGKTDFNGGYNEDEVVFSAELTAKVAALEADIKAELTKTLS
jgi:hypothetical protein